MNDLYDSNQYFGDYQMNAGSQYGNQGPAMPYGNQEPAMPYGESSQMPSQTYVSTPQQNQMYGAPQGQSYGNQQYNTMHRAFKNRINVIMDNPFLSVKLFLKPGDQGVQVQI